MMGGAAEGLIGSQSMSSLHCHLLSRRLGSRWLVTWHSAGCVKLLLVPLDFGCVCKESKTQWSEESQKMVSPQTSGDDVWAPDEERDDLDECWIDENFLPNVMPPVLILEFILGLLGNGFTIWVTWWHVKVWTSYTIYLFNLALTDLLFVVQLPLRVHYHMRLNDWVLGEFMCDMVVFFFYANMYGSIYFLTCISVERWQVIERPLRSLSRRRSLMRAKLVSVALWFLALVPQAGMPFIFHTFEHKNQTRCLSFNQPWLMRNFNVWNAVEMVLGFLLPFGIMLVFHVRIARKLLCSSTNPRLLQTRKRAAHFMIVILLIFAICFIPVHIMRSLLIAVKLLVPKNCGLHQMVAQVFYWCLLLSSCNCIMDPLILFLSGDRFRVAASVVLRKFWGPACACEEPGRAMGNKSVVIAVHLHSIEIKTDDATYRESIGGSGVQEKQPKGRKARRKKSADEGARQGRGMGSERSAESRGVAMGAASRGEQRAERKEGFAGRTKPRTDQTSTWLTQDRGQKLAGANGATAVLGNGVRAMEIRTIAGVGYGEETARRVATERGNEVGDRESFCSHKNTEVPTN
uniref:2-oxoglutarate receptor 1-like n=1 Tax=Petromyzon marinus TaxID=7757 RepID=A0AAJ7U622_PETMA|nr:2-oxoglutarate receptor 1-like [Petromyzon marinus]